jgi:hypothetical protein
VVLSAEEGSWYARANLAMSAARLLSFVVGLVMLGAGSYATIVGIGKVQRDGTAHRPFTCRSTQS